MKSNSARGEIADNGWRIAGIIILCVRFVQGWIYWGGGSRRFIYAPMKLDPYSSEWMANKLQSAMPGALLGTQQIINYLLQHFVLLYLAIVLFSLVELLSGVALIFGCFTRAAGFISAFVSIILLLVFGWQGATCLDEWTMAVATLSMGFTLGLSGAPIYSIDAWLLKRYPKLFHRQWFNDFASGHWPFAKLRRIGLMCFVFTILFTVTSYNYYRGSVYSSFHPGPVSPMEHHITLSHGTITSGGVIQFGAYVDAGTPALPSNIIRIELLNAKGLQIATWESKELSELSQNDIKNIYAYNLFHVGAYGIVAPVGASATINLILHQRLPADEYQLQLYSINGHRWNVALKYLQN